MAASAGQHPLGANLRVTAHCNRGGRKYMEDFFSVAYQESDSERDLEYAFVGIFDGHGGADAARYVREHLINMIVSQRLFWSDTDDDVLQAIREGYIATHYAMWRDQDKWPKTANGLPSTAGTTASVAFIRHGKIYIGHCGDSGIVLGFTDPPEPADGDRTPTAVAGEPCTALAAGEVTADATTAACSATAPADTGPKWSAVSLTIDHKPESAAEKARIKRSGGKVTVKSGVPRVVWNRPKLGHKGPVRRDTPVDEIPFLAVARSMGDFWSYNTITNKFIVSPDPDVRVVKIDPERFRCLIFGTDGLWNVLSPGAAVEVARTVELHNDACTAAGRDADWTNPSRALVDKAMERWGITRMRADNTSVVIVMLDAPGRPKRDTGRHNGPPQFLVENELYAGSTPAAAANADGGEDVEQTPQVLVNPNSNCTLFDHHVSKTLIDLAPCSAKPDDAPAGGDASTCARTDPPPERLVQPRSPRELIPFGFAFADSGEAILPTFSIPYEIAYAAAFNAAIRPVTADPLAPGASVAWDGPSTIDERILSIALISIATKAPIAGVNCTETAASKLRRPKPAEKTAAAAGSVRLVPRAIVEAFLTDYGKKPAAGTLVDVGCEGGAEALQAGCSKAAETAKVDPGETGDSAENSETHVSAVREKIDRVTIVEKIGQADKDKETGIIELSDTEVCAEAVNDSRKEDGVADISLNDSVQSHDDADATNQCIEATDETAAIDSVADESTVELTEDGPADDELNVAADEQNVSITLDDSPTATLDESVPPEDNATESTDANAPSAADSDASPDSLPPTEVIQIHEVSSSSVPPPPPKTSTTGDEPVASVAASVQPTAPIAAAPSMSLRSSDRKRTAGPPQLASAGNGAKKPKTMAVVAATALSARVESNADAGDNDVRRLRSCDPANASGDTKTTTTTTTTKTTTMVRRETRTVRGKLRTRTQFAVIQTRTKSLVRSLSSGTRKLIAAAAVVTSAPDATAHGRRAGRASAADATEAKSTPLVARRKLVRSGVATPAVTRPARAIRTPRRD